MTEADVAIDPTDPGLAVAVWALLGVVRGKLPAKVRPWIPYLAVLLAGVLRGALDASARGQVDGSTLVRAGVSGAFAVLGQAATRAPAKARRAVGAPDGERR